MGWQLRRQVRQERCALSDPEGEDAGSLALSSIPAFTLWAQREECEERHAAPPGWFGVF